MMSEETLHAYVDGALSPEDAAEVVLYLADHPEDQARVDAMMALNETLARAYETPADDAVPQAILDTILQPIAAPASSEAGATVIPFRRRKTVWMVAGLALAASIALAAVMLPQMSAPKSNHLTVGPVAQNSVLDTTLSREVSGVPVPLDDGATLTPVASFATTTLGMCREVELLNPARDELETAIACRRNGDSWHIELATAVTGSSDDTGFVPASGQGPDMISRFLDAIGAGFTLTPDEEEREISYKWKGVSPS